MKSGLFILFILIEFANSKNILVLCPMAPKSHKNIFKPITHALASRGHDVTMVTSFPPASGDIAIQNVTEIIGGSVHKLIRQIQSTMSWHQGGLLGHLTFSLNPILESCHQIYQNEQFMQLLDKKFDLIFIDSFFHDCLLGFVHQVSKNSGGTPFVIVSGLPAPTHITQLAGNRLPASFVPNFMMWCSDDMNFFQRTLNLVVNLVMETFLHSWLSNESTTIYRHYLGQHLPHVTQINQNVAMLMVNSHPITNSPRPTLPDVVEIGGVHCQPAKPLPKDLDQFVSKWGQNGFILFSLGSLVEGHMMPIKVRRMFLSVFSRLPQGVIWKWDSGVMGEKIPENVKLVKWLPQQSLLGHANVSLFITHGGLLSMEEALYFGVPLLGFPLFADQPTNVQKAVKNGYALSMDIFSVTPNSLDTNIRRILNDKGFSRKAKEFSKLYRDQETTPLDRVLYWSEFLIRHRGAEHLHSVARKLNFVEYYSIDSISFLLIIVIGLIGICNYLLSLFKFNLKFNFHSKDQMQKGCQNFAKKLRLD